MTTAWRGRFYWCEGCDVYGRGGTCWSCGSDDVSWDHVPADKIPSTGGMTNPSP